MIFLYHLVWLEMAGGASEYHEDVELLQLLVLWILTYVSAFFAEHTRLSPLLFYILFGAVPTAVLSHRVCWLHVPNERRTEPERYF